MFQLVCEVVSKLSRFVFQTRLLSRRPWKSTSSGLLVENLSQGSQFDLRDNTCSIPLGLVQPGDFVRLTGGGVTVQGNLADLGGFLLVSSWFRSTLAEGEFVASIQSDFASAFRRGLALSRPELMGGCL